MFATFPLLHITDDLKYAGSQRKVFPFVVLQYIDFTFVVSYNRKQFLACYRWYILKSPVISQQASFDK